MRLSTTIILGLALMASAILAAGPTDQIGPLVGVSEDLARLEQPTNDSRREALEFLLQVRSLPYELEHFESLRPGARRARGTNVIVTIGDGPRDLLVSAHYDAAFADSSLTGGALDNGAGVVALVRVADRLRTRRLNHRVRLVFFDMEEVGLLGSQHHISQLEAEVAASINVDVVGRGDTIMLGPSRHAGNEVLYETAASVCGDRYHRCLEFPRYAPSDDISFQTAGIPNISLGLLPQLEAHQFWLQLNGGDDADKASALIPATVAQLHTADDRPDQVEPAAITLAVDFLLALICRIDAELADSPTLR